MDIYLYMVLHKILLFELWIELDFHLYDPHSYSTVHHSTWGLLDIIMTQSRIIAQLPNDKDSENTKKLTKQLRLIFESHLGEKNRNPTNAVDLEAVLRRGQKKGWIGAKLLKVKLLFSFKSLKIF